MKINAVLIAATLSVSLGSLSPPARAAAGQSSSLLQKARLAFDNAQSLESELNEKPETERTRGAYVKVIDAYQRVFLTTPHTGYADNALMTIARLYEEIRERPAAIRTLNFLLRDYPDTPFKDAAEKDLARLRGVALQKTAAVDNIRYWEELNSVRIVVDVSAEIKFKQGEAKDPHRVFIDISPARVNSLLLGKQWMVQSGLLQQIRVGQYDASTVRVVLDLGAVARVSSFSLREPDRLIIDVLAKEARAALQAAKTPATAPVTTVAAAPPPPDSTKSAKAKPSVETAKLPIDTAKKTGGTAKSPVDTVSPPVESAMIPAETVRIPAESARLSVETAKPPVAAAKSPAGAAKPPVGTTKPPVGSATIPAETVKTPADSARLSVETAKPPVAAAKSPAGAAKPPVGTTKPPVEIATIPAETVKTPADSARLPVETAKPPVGAAKSPAGAAKPPVGTTKPPVEIATIPADTLETPAETARLPVETAKPPVGAAKSPVGAAKPRVETTKPPVGTAKLPVETSRPPVATAKPPAEAKVITPARASIDGTSSLVRSLGLKLSRVVIDAGHGGHDTGSIGPGGYTEKELVLDVAERLRQLIESELGADVVMTRSDDSFVPLETRTALANQEQADLFISLHANSSRSRSVRGVETFFLNFSSSRENVEIATRENAASERSIHDLQDLVKKIMLQDKVDESRELAQHIQRAMAVRKGAGMDRGVKQAPFIVLIGANMPSVLAEIAFISNPQEENLIKNAQTRQAIAESLFHGVKSYAESLSGMKTAKSQDKN